MWYANGSALVKMAKTPSGAIGFLLLLALLALAVMAPLLWSEQANAVDSDLISSGPVPGHPFGTDALGRDILFRTLVATRTSLVLAILATTITLVIGILLGVAPSLLGPRAGRFFEGLINIALAFPALLMVLIFAVIFGVTTTGAVLALGLAGVPALARLVQTMAASLSGRDFVAAASVAGVSRLRILVRHLVPNMGEQLVINTMLNVAGALLSFAGLSFLGIGVRPPQYDWGVLLNQGLQGIYVNPAGALIPAAAVVLAGLAFNLLGEGAAQVIGQQDAVLPFRSRPFFPTRGTSEPASVADDSVLIVDNLSVSYPSEDGWITPVRGIGFAIRRGESVGIVGESGSGKSQTALAASALIERPGSVTADRLEFDGIPLTGVIRRAAKKHLGNALAMIFQDPMTSLNPALRIGVQMTEGAVQNQGVRPAEARERATRRLGDVHLQRARQRLGQYPHELSGGMRQRVMIAMGLMGAPRLIIADEPTTALDATVQRQVLDVLREVREREGSALLLISHDIGVVVETCDRVMVMYAGRIVEELPAQTLHESARHPYTRALLAAVPSMDSARDEPLAMIPGRPPAPQDFPAGCAFADRCAFATDRCREEDPVLLTHGTDHRVACWNPQAVGVRAAELKETGA